MQNLDCMRRGYFVQLLYNYYSRIGQSSACHGHIAKLYSIAVAMDDLTVLCCHFVPQTLQTSLFRSL